MSSLPEWMPRKRADVLVADFETELVVLVPDQRRAHHLDEGLSLVLDSCDGATPTAAVVEEVASGTGNSVADVENWLGHALTTLRQLATLEDGPAAAAERSINEEGHDGPS